MSVRLRLQRHGSKKSPFYRVVAADSRARRDGKYIEQLGVYHPLVEAPIVLNLDIERVDHWLSVGAQPSDTVQTLIRIAREGNVRSIQQYEAERREAKKAQREAALKGIAVPPPEPAAKAEAPAAEAPAAEAAPVEETPAEEAPAEG